MSDKLYAAGISAQINTNNIISVCITVANNRELARNHAIENAKAQWPISQGYTRHSAALMEIPNYIIDIIAKENGLID